MTKLEIKISIKSMIFLNKKRDETIKSSMCENGSTQRVYISYEGKTGLTAESESIITTGVIGVKQKRDVMK